MATGLWHHYVPQMYLRGFLDPFEVAKGQNLLWCYRVGYKPKRMATKKVAAASGFYYAPDVPGAENETEQALSELETIASKHLRKLRGGDIKLSEQEKAEFATFIGLTVMRTAIARQRANAIAIELMRQGFAKALKEGGVEKLVADYAKKTGKVLTTDTESFGRLAAGIADGTVEMHQGSVGWGARSASLR